MRDSSTSVTALRQRLWAVAEVLLDETPARHKDVARDAANLLSALVAVARDSLRADHAWILHTAVSGHMPLADDVADLLRHLELATSATDAEIWLLRRARSAIALHGRPAGALEVVAGGVVVDVTFSAQNDKHTGIQRVTREVCPRWDAAHLLTLAAWSPSQSTLCALTTRERDRVLAWEHPSPAAALEDPPNGPEPTILVPWRSTVVLPEVAQGTTSRPLAALAQCSGNQVVAIGYDAIPVVSADLRPVSEPNQFVGYLTVIKHASRVVGISTSAAAEFQGFTEAIRAQGLPGPVVSEVELAAEVPAVTDIGDGDRGGLEVLCVGSHELHKNHLAVLHAAELLWREGLTFGLTFVGGNGWDMTGFDARLRELTAQGRNVTNLGSVTDTELWSAYRRARFTVFPSIHEGFGLPVAESLACGTPAVTTQYGSTQEIARRGGCLLIDPRDDLDIARAMRTLLSDDATYARLKEEARVAPRKTWDAYAAELWQHLVEGTGARR